MISYDQLHSRYAALFSAFDPVDENIARCVRSVRGLPFAIYYLDISGSVPTSLEELDRYQDRVIGPHYFDGSKSLQWSHYLYFVVDSGLDTEKRSLIERDRKYARKYVVGEADLESALTPPKFQVAEGVVDASVFSTWTSILTESNLAEAVLSDESLPKKIERIEADFGQGSLGTSTVAPLPTAPAPAFLSTLSLRQFRAHPIIRDFDFGTVTLLTGPNGVGKTSLLEAIELLYCGKTKRNPASRESYTLEATFRDGSAETARSSRSARLFRDRNLAWYGQADLRTNTLFQSFARYNFLDTDAAVGIATAKDEIEENLSKLLVGAEASKTWREIERLSKELDRKVREHSGTVQQAKLELQRVEKQLAEAAAVPKESDALLDSLTKTLAESGWLISREATTSRLDELVTTFAKQQAFADEATKLEWIRKPTTIEGLSKFVESTETLLGEARQVQASCRALTSQLKAVTDRTESLRNKSSLFEEAWEYCRVDFGSLLRSVSLNGEKQSKLRPVILHVNNLPGGVASVPDDKAPVRDFVEATRSLQAEKREAHSAANAELEKFTQLRQQSENLAQQLRHTAMQILQDESKRDSCPLCHTPFDPDKLLAQISLKLDENAESRSTVLRDSVRRAEQEFSVAQARLAIAEWLREYCSLTKMPADSTAAQVKTHVTDRLNQYRESQKAFEIGNARLQGLEESGLRKDRYEELAAWLNELEVELTTESLNSQIARIKEELAESSRDLDSLSASRADSLETVARLFEVDSITESSMSAELDKRTQQRDVAQSLLRSTPDVSTDLEIDANENLQDLATKFRLVRKLVTDVKSAMAAEGEASAILSNATKTKADVEEHLAGLTPRVNRLTRAAAVLRELLDKHSLKSAMEQALEQNQNAIDEIFRRIHNPAEFSKLENMTTLVRRTGGTATLQEISTGQRAAFALSLFLAQNAQLRSAPPLMLIDDPIAHVDDMNCLSFLDYLREVAISEERQIVFATASDKLAALFSRKFDFLGESEFKRYNLTR